MLAMFVTVFGNTVNAKDIFDCTGGGTETFSNLGGASSAYQTRTWTGDNSIIWSATDARTDQDLTGDAIAIREGALTNTTSITGGIGTLTFNYQRVFTGNSTLKVYVNGVQYGADILVSQTTTSVYSQTINVIGNATIQIVNTGNRVIIDDVSWNCYPSVVGPDIQIQDAQANNYACGEYTLNFGTTAISSNTDAVFTVRNLGTANLVISSISLTNSTDFSIVSPTGTATVAPSGTAFVVVRFNSASAGVKTGTLTINSNDSDEVTCAVSLTGNAQLPCVAPGVQSAAEVTFNNITYDAADITIDGITADGYIAILSTSATLTSFPLDNITYFEGDSFGGGTIIYVGNSENINAGGLSGSTTYYVHILPYNNLCAGGPLYNEDAAIVESFTTALAPCIGGSETFTNIGANSSAYATRTWTGDNGVLWNATDARTDQTLNGKALAFRAGVLTNTTPVTGGMGTLTFKYKRVFTGDSTLKVFVNDVQYGDDIIVTSETESIFSEMINVEGDVTIRIENSGNRTIIDDLAWDCYETPDRPEILLISETGAQQHCGDFTIDFGNVEIDSYNEVTFTIKNTGLQSLVISSITTDEASFVVQSPVTPITIASLASEDVVVSFENPSVGTVSGLLTIVSNDADESPCTVNLVANAQPHCSIPDIDGGAVVISDVTDNSANIEVQSITASGYLVLVDTAAITVAPLEGETYNVGDLIGTAIVAYVGTSNTFAVENLDPETTYNVSVFAYNNTDCVGGPVYAEALEDEIATIEAPCVGGAETFTNLGANSSAYSVRNWTGDNGVTWTANDARTDQTLTGKAIAIRTGSVKNTVAVPNGIGALTFNYKRVFTGNSTIKILVNGVQYGSDIVVSSETATLHTEVINVSGNVVVELQNSGNRSIIDDIAWDCYSEPGFMKSAMEQKPEIQVYPNPNNGQFQINMENEFADVKVYDGFGKVVFAKTVAKNETIHLEYVVKGVYMVVINTGADSVTKRIVIE